MLRKCTKYIFLLLFALLLIPTSIYPATTQENETTHATTTNKISYTYSSSYSSSYSSNSSTFITEDEGYIIKNYDVSMKVGKDNVFHIIETIDVDFLEYRHGIYRTIPLFNKIKRPEGKNSTQRAKLTNVKVNANYTSSTANGETTLKIGDKNKLIMGNKNYIISYDYNIGKDGIKDFDELYFNIIGPEWTTKIEKVTFNIEMPKQFDETKLGFSNGYAGTIGYSNLEFYTEYDDVTNTHSIIGETTSGLSARQALTVRLELPENYFSEAENLWAPLLTISIVAPLVAFAIVIVLYLYARNHNRKVPTVEFYPPEGLNSLDVALIYKSKVNNKDSVSLLVYLASNGYIKIEELGNRRKEIKLTKIKDYEGNNDHESKFMQGLFNKKDSVLLSGINKNSFSKKVTDIVHTTNVSERNLYYEKNSTLFKVLSYALAIVAAISAGYPAFETSNFLFVIIYAFPLIALLALLPSFVSSKNPLIIIFALFWGGLPFVLAILQPLLFIGIEFAISACLGLVYAGIIRFCFVNKVAIKNKNGGELYAKIEGFKKFINTAEKSRLESLCLENPSYYYDLLPYAYVLGVSDVWIKKFENISIPPVDWYCGTSDNILRASTFDSICTTTSNMSHYSSSSSGGGSGGGSSGGGSGGGGGGSW